LREGCRDALILWGETLIDGHNRYAICEHHGLPYKTVQNTHLQSIEDVILWLIDNHIGRRSVSDFQRGMLALRQKEIIEARDNAAHAGTTSQETAQQRQRSKLAINPKKCAKKSPKVRVLVKTTVSQIEKSNERQHQP